jgi:hypothetical protein
MKRHPFWKDWKTLLPPFLFGLAPMVFLLSKNFGQVPIREVAGVSALVLLGIFLLQWFGRRPGWDPDSYSVLLSFAVFSLLSYGQIYLLVLPLIFYPLTSQQPDFPLSSVEILAHVLLCAVLLLAGHLLFVLIRRSAALRRAATEFTLFMGAILVLVPTINIFTLLAVRPAASIPQPADRPNSAAAVTDAPDIYYFILDGYARKDVLADLFQYDNTPFLAGLEARGFYIVDGAKSNYSQTSLSFTSTWNMEYLDTLVSEYDPELGSTQVLHVLEPYLRKNRVLERLRADGYLSYVFASGFPPTEWTWADEFLQPARHSSGLMESLLIETTGLRLVESAYSTFGWTFPYPGYRRHLERLQYVFNTFPDLIPQPGPKIIIAHLIAPHPPFVVDASGQEISPRSIYRLSDGGDFAGTHEEYVEGYRGEVIWINGKMTELIDTILERSVRPPVIILQSDHGAAVQINWSNPQPEGMRIRMRNLTALYLPGDGTPEPYPTMTPVNIFRLIFDRYLHGTYGFLPDHSYFSSPYFLFSILLEDTSIP